MLKPSTSKKRKAEFECLRASIQVMTEDFEREELETHVIRGARQLKRRKSPARQPLAPPPETLLLQRQRQEEEEVLLLQQQQRYPLFASPLASRAELRARNLRHLLCFILHHDYAQPGLRHALAARRAGKEAEKKERKSKTRTRTRTDLSSCSATSTTTSSVDDSQAETPPYARLPRRLAQQYSARALPLQPYRTAPARARAALRNLVLQPARALKLPPGAVCALLRRWQRFSIRGGTTYGGAVAAVAACDGLAALAAMLALDAAVTVPALAGPTTRLRWECLAGVKAVRKRYFGEGVGGEAVLVDVGVEYAYAGDQVENELVLGGGTGFETFLGSGRADAGAGTGTSTGWVRLTPEGARVHASRQTGLSRALGGLLGRGSANAAITLGVAKAARGLRRCLRWRGSGSGAAAASSSACCSDAAETLVVDVGAAHRRRAQAFDMRGWVEDVRRREAVAAAAAAAAAAQAQAQGAGSADVGVDGLEVAGVGEEEVLCLRAMMG